MLFYISFICLRRVRTNGGTYLRVGPLHFEGRVVTAYKVNVLFWSSFSTIRTEYGEILRISPYSVRMQENADQNNSEYGHFLLSVLNMIKQTLEGSYLFRKIYIFVRAHHGLPNTRPYMSHLKAKNSEASFQFRKLSVTNL